MTLHYTWPRPGVTSFSVDGIEHKINPDTGNLDVEVMTPNLPRELELAGATLAPEPSSTRSTDPTDPPLQAQANQLSPAEEAERQELITTLDTITGRRVDRRRSLQQLRAMKAEIDQKG